MGIVLYADWNSQPCKAVGIFLSINNIEFDLKPVDLMHGGTKTSEYTSINPCQTVPTLIEDEFKLVESSAMLKYLAGKDGVPEHWYPRDPRVRAKVDEYMAYQHTGIRPKASECMVETVLKPLFLKAPTDEKVLKEKKEALEKQLNLIENYFLQDRTFLTGSDVTIADIMCAMELHAVDCLVLRLKDGHGNLDSYLSRVADKLAPHYDKYNEIIEGFAKEKLGWSN